MPRYTYAHSDGDDCGHALTDVVQRMSDDAWTECPNCGKPIHRVPQPLAGARKQPDEQIYHPWWREEPIVLTGSPQQRRDVCRREAASQGYFKTEEHGFD